MCRAFYFVGCVICSVLCVVALVGVERIGLALPVGPGAELLAVALFGLSFIVLLAGFWWPLGRRSHSARGTASPMLMRAPRFHSDRTTGPSYFGIRG
jgi:hypothetical protein